MVDKFLHKIDLDALQKEVGMTIDEIGALIEMKNPKGIYNWAKGQDNHGTRPSYNALIRLLLAGATTMPGFVRAFFLPAKKEKEPKRKKYYPKHPISDLYIL